MDAATSINSAYAATSQWEASRESRFPFCSSTEATLDSFITALSLSYTVNCHVLALEHRFTDPGELCQSAQAIGDPLARAYHHVLNVVLLQEAHCLRSIGVWCRWL